MTLEIIDPRFIDLKPSEFITPFFDWLGFLTHIAQECTNRYPFRYHVEGDKYNSIDYWRVILYQHNSTFNTKGASDSLNRFLFERQNKTDHDRQLNGSVERFERLVPHESQINQFLRVMPKKIKRDLTQILLEIQVKEARRMGLLDSIIEVFVDDHNEWYYGGDRFPDNSQIIGTNKGRGTNRMRNLCAVMIGSSAISLFAGCFYEQKQQSHLPNLLEVFKLLREWGFTIKRVFADRGFTCFDLVFELLAIDIPYTGSIKRAGKLKTVLIEYLEGRSPPVVKFELVAPKSAKNQGTSIPVMLIMKTHPHKRVRDIRRAYRNGELSVSEAIKQLHIFITTESPPKKRSQWTKWGLRIIQSFRHRWRIESGFANLSRVGSTSHARTNDAKLLGWVFRMFIYNTWQIQKALHRQIENVPKAWQKGPSLREFGDRMNRVLIMQS